MIGLPYLDAQGIYETMLWLSPQAFPCVRMLRRAIYQTGHAPSHYNPSHCRSNQTFCRSQCLVGSSCVLRIRVNHAVGRQGTQA